VGVIRWDYWSVDSPRTSDLTLALSQPEWRYRLPFYTTHLSRMPVTIREDRQGVMDQEIRYASRAGIDYWAFDFYDPAGIGAPPMHMNYGVELYRSSEESDRMRYALIVVDGTDRDRWSAYTDALVEHFADPRYQTVDGGRPLLYLFDAVNMPYSRSGIDTLRRKTLAAGLPQPYLVAMVWEPPTGAPVVERLGLDALGAYLLGTDPVGEHPYSALAANDRRFWEGSRSLGLQVVPLVVSSYDSRPNWEYPPPWQPSLTGPWYLEPSPSELADHLDEAFAWVAADPSHTVPNTILIYAWNETGEGGLNIVPTLSEGTARLDAIQAVTAAWARRLGTG
jgi:hypothetical protein